MSPGTPFCPTCGAREYTNMQCIVCLRWQRDRAPLRRDVYDRLIRQIEQRQSEALLSDEKNQPQSEER